MSVVGEKVCVVELDTHWRGAIFLDKNRFLRLPIKLAIELANFNPL